MKRVMILTTLLVSIFYTDNIMAQLHVNFDVNIGKQPVWGPVGYEHAEYYYLPEIEAYYCIPKRKFVFQDGGDWRFASVLPERYGNYDMNRAYKVVINDPRPYFSHAYYREKYSRYREHHDPQPIIRESDDPRYYQIKEHPKHDQWRNYREKYEHR